MDKKYIVSDVMFGYLMTHNPQYMGDDFLSKLLSYGKTAYLMNLLLLMKIQKKINLDIIKVN